MGIVHEEEKIEANYDMSAGDVFHAAVIVVVEYDGADTDCR